MSRKPKISAIRIGFSLLMFAGSCKKRVPPAPPPPPPAAVKPTPPPAAKEPVVSQFSAEPSSIERGQSATLRWVVSDATEVSIDQGIGTVQSTGTRQVFPSNAITYTLTATGPGGNA